MTIKIKKNEEIIIEVKGGGPYKNFYFYKIHSKCKAKILWKKYIRSGCTVPGDFTTWTVQYEDIDLGTVDIQKNDMIDMVNKFYPSSKERNRYLKIGDININQGGTSSDKYIITFLENSKYTPFVETWVDK